MNEFHKMYEGDTSDVDTMITELSKKKIIFGHQSVGYNILSGIGQWEEETGVKLNRMTTRDIATQGDEVFIDFAVGSNANPESKIDDFVSLVEGLPDESEIIAFFKLCYVDITAETDIEKLFGYYKERMHYLKGKRKNISIVLFTVPVTSVQRGWKAAVKKILGRAPAGAENNIKRYEFNRRVIDELSGDFPVFDLAGVETTLPDGTMSTFKYRGVVYPCMPEIYTSDGGHLNSYGSKIAAYNLLAFLTGEIK